MACGLLALVAALLLAMPARAAAEAPAVTTDEASAIGKETATLNGTVNPNGEEVTKCQLEYGTTEAYGEAAPCSPLPGLGIIPVGISASISGLTANTTYHFRISATNASGPSKGTDVTFTTLPNAPVVKTEKATEVKQMTATMNATVNPEGVSASSCEFEYGTTVVTEHKVSCSGALPSGSSPVAVSAAIPALTANTSYIFRIVASNTGATGTGAEETFTTPPNAPTVEAKAASSVTQTTATLNATVSPEGSEVGKCEFEYGETASYGKTAACSSLPGSGPSPVEVSAPLSGLSPNTTYHFRITATNAGGESKGADETFATPAVISLPGSPPFNTGEINATSTTRPGLPRPVLGQSVNIAAVMGRVALRTPGSAGFVTLSGARQVPYGTVVEATAGEVGVTAATPAGGLWAGRFFDGKFVLTQTRNGTVLATLAGGNFSVCSQRAHARRTSRHASGAHLVRRLWAESGGNFSTRGRYAQGIVRGAQWLTEDLCEGTLVLATRDRVQVADLVHRRQVQLVAGRIAIVKPR